MRTLLLTMLVSLNAHAESRVVTVGDAIEPGTIVVQTRERALYLALGDGRALRYPVAVGKAGKGWSGVTHINGKYLRPAWAPPAVVRRDRPGMRSLYAGGAPDNPMGEAALTLTGGEYAIHGTTIRMRSSIGTAASYGCIRMFNEDVLDLYARVQVGTTVVVR